MRLYEDKLLERLQNDSYEIGQNDVPILIKPIPDENKNYGMDPRMLELAREKCKKLSNQFDAQQFQLYQERFRPDKINYDLTSGQVNQKQRLIELEQRFINTFWYRPSRGGDKKPVVIYVHGGAYMTGEHTMFDNQCRLLAEKSEAVVIFPEYRLTPENPFPAGLEDIYQIMEWVYEHGEAEGIDSERIVLAGDSAGAGLINGCALMDGEVRIRLLLEIYPCCDINMENNGVYRWDESMYDIPDDERQIILRRMGRMRELCKAMETFYLKGGKDSKEPRISVIYQEDFTEFPEVVIFTGEYDYLRIGGDIFAEKCHQAGKLRKHIRYQGCDHGFFDMLGILPQAEDCIIEMAEVIKNNV